MSLVDLLDRPIAYQRVYRQVTGSTVAALFLSQLTYWQRIVDQGKGGVNGWIYKTMSEMEMETGLSRHEQVTARKCLIKKKIIEEKKEGLPRKLYYRVRWTVLEDYLQLYQHNAGIRQTSLPGCGTLACRDAASKSAGIRQAGIYNTETTTTTTTTRQGGGGGENEKEQYIAAATAAADPADPAAYAAGIRRRLQAQGGLLVDDDRQQLELWLSAPLPVPALRPGMVIRVSGAVSGAEEAEIRITDVTGSVVIDDTGTYYPVGPLLAAIRDGAAVLAAGKEEA